MAITNYETEGLRGRNGNSWDNRQTTVVMYVCMCDKGLRGSYLKVVEEIWPSSWQIKENCLFLKIGLESVRHK